MSIDAFNRIISRFCFTMSLDALKASLIIFSTW